MIDAVIAGAGPNGLMLANELGLAGIRPVVLEPLAGPNPQRRANGITGQAVRLLDHRDLYGVVSGTPDPPQPSPWVMFAAMALDLTKVPDSQHFMVPVQQPRLVHILAERVRASGADIRWGHRLAGFEQHGDGVVVRVEGPDGSYELPAQYLIGADGGTSQTRKLAGIDFPGMTSHDAVARMAFGVAPPADWVDPSTGMLTIPGLGPLPPTPFHRAERGVFACRRLGDRAMVITMELDRSADEDRVDGGDDAYNEEPVSLAEIEASLKRVVGVDVPLTPVASDQPLDLRRFYGINSRIASQYRSGRVFVVGDAAHVHSPMGGPGLNLGLQDAVNLGWKLAAVISGGADPALLDTYQAERRPAAERVIMHSRAQLALVRPGTEISALRGMFSELLEDPNNAKRIGDLLSGNDNHYALGEHPLAGRWVPDFAVASDGAEQRVAELARSGRPLLIDLTADAVVAAATSAVTERITVVTGHAIGDVSATALLVRPDGYVAWASSAARPDVDELRPILRDWFGIKVD
ncbi:MAG TPA: FAD-dependent monooxygenase [Mycobacterium sp.]|nr:FAD-dependent monooxygenase [Mycobacterium sp.]